MGTQKVRIVRLERILHDGKPTDRYGVTFAILGYDSKIVIPIAEHVDDEQRIKLARARLHDLLKLLSSETETWEVSKDAQNEMATRSDPIRQMPGPQD